MTRIGKTVLVVVVIIVALPVLAILGIIYARRIKPNTLLTVEIEDAIPERTPDNSLQDMLSGPSTTVTDITEGIERARTDPHITGLEIRVGETTMGMAQIQEIRDAHSGTSTAPANLAWLTWSLPRTDPITSPRLARR